ncbi:MAG: histidine kinase [Bacteroidota bacterium]
MNETIEIPMKAIPPVISFFFMTLTLGTTFEMLMDWERRGKIIEKTEKEKLSAELSFLKTQINPHFFFNTLNSIYALAATDTQSTQQAILILSNLMRYILYESNVSKIALSKEVQFLKNYIDLQQLRYTKSSSKKVEFEYHGNLNEFNIEPLLLVTFVENAFKHSHSYDRETLIRVVLEACQDEELVFKVSNTVGDFSEQMEKESGIGLENVKRRLDLLYPDKHQLAIDRINGYYNVVLTLSK